MPNLKNNGEPAASLITREKKGTRETGIKVDLPTVRENKTVT